MCRLYGPSNRRWPHFPQEGEPLLQLSTEGVADAVEAATGAVEGASDALEEFPLMGAAAGPNVIEAGAGGNVGFTKEAAGPSTLTGLRSCASSCRTDRMVAFMFIPLSLLRRGTTPRQHGHTCISQLR